MTCLSHMLMTFFNLLFLTKGSSATVTLWTPTTLVFKVSLKSFLFVYQQDKNLARGKIQGTDMSTIPFGVVFMMPALLIR